MKKTSGFLFTELSKDNLIPGKPFDGFAPCNTRDMHGTPVVINPEELEVYLSNMQAAIEESRTESGEIVGLPIDAGVTGDHDKGDAGGWIVGVEREGNVLRFIPKWNELGMEVISKSIRRYFSPTIDLKNKKIVGGSMTNYSAINFGAGKVVLRPIELAAPNTLYELAESTEESLNDQLSDVYEAWRALCLARVCEDCGSTINAGDAYCAACGCAMMTGYVVDVFEDHIVAQRGEEMFEVAYTRGDDKIAFAPMDEWKPVKRAYVDAAIRRLGNSLRSVLGLTELASGFDDSAWDGPAVTSKLDVAGLRKVSLLDLNGYPGQEGDPVKELVKLPIRKTPGGKVNINALKAVGGGHGISEVKKPDSVPEEYFNKKIKAAAKTVAGLWKKAFDTDVPEGIQKAVDMSQGDTTMTVQLSELSAEDRAQLVAQLAEQLKTTTGAGSTTGTTTPTLDMSSFFNVDGLSDSAKAERKRQLGEYVAQVQLRAELEYKNELMELQHKTNIANLSMRLTGGTKDAPRGLRGVGADELSGHLLKLPTDEQNFWIGILENQVKDGLVNFSEMGHGGVVKGQTKLPDEIAAKLRDKSLGIADLSNPILGLGNVSDYNLSEFTN